MGTNISTDAARAAACRRPEQRRPRRGPGLPGRLRDERGQAMVEFAFVIPIFLLVVVGILFFARFLTYTSDATHLSEIAVRYASVNEDPACALGTSPNSCSTNLATYVASQGVTGEFSSRPNSSDPTYAVKQGGSVGICIGAPGGGTGAQGTPIAATVTATFQAIPFLGFTTIHVSETSSEMMEQNADLALYSNDSAGASPTCPS